MTTFTELLRKAEQSEQYWVSGAQIDFSFKLADVMAEEGLNQSQLADVLGVSRPYVSKLLAGNQNLTLKAMVQYARKLGRVLNLELVKQGESRKSSEYSVKKSDGDQYLARWFGADAQNDAIIGEFQFCDLDDSELRLVEAA